MSRLKSGTADAEVKHARIQSGIALSGRVIGAKLLGLAERRAAQPRRV
jgi:hypothetical protein